MLPVITKPTRITSHTATLIDHIYMNYFNQQKSSEIATVDISDHLLVFCICGTVVNHCQQSNLYNKF